MTLVKIRLRHQSGDCAPISLESRDTVGELKTRILNDWNRLTADNTIQAETPASVACIKLILNGKFLDNDEILSDLQNTLTDPADHSMITMHVVVRPQSSLKSPAKPKGKEAKKRCMCVIC